MEELPIIVLGAGGHAKVLIDALLLAGKEVIGCTDPATDRTSILGVSVLGDDSVLAQYGPRAVALVNGVGSIGPPNRREQVFEKFRSLGYEFSNVCHPSAILSADVAFGSGVQVMAGAVLQPGVRVEDNVIVNTRASVDHDCVIGAHAHIAPGATLCGEVKVGRRTHVGAGATVIQGTRIGNNVLVRAGALVIRDVADSSDVGGVPGREIIS